MRISISLQIELRHMDTYITELRISRYKKLTCYDQFFMEVKFL